MHLSLDAKWFCFRALEVLSELRMRWRGHSGFPCEMAGAGRREQTKHIWVFTSTIGELNAIEPLLKRLTRDPSTPLALLTDREHYRESLLAKYPSARVLVIDHRTSRIRELIREVPPSLLLLAEIPCLLSDAPCRFPFALAYEAKKRGVPICLVNGWLYRQQPTCWMDRLEKFLFGRDFLRLFDVITVQDEDIRRSLLDGGAHPDRVFVTGNMKFDVLAQAAWDPRSAKSPKLLDAIRQSGRPVLTAGCVTNVPEQALVLDAFRLAAKLPSDPLLVLAPRHPENAERMRILERLLAERGYRFVLKSKLGGAPITDDIQCLVLDTLGELKDFYALSTFSYVGLNHNLLEPMMFGKKVLVTPGWDPDHPAYSVYKLLTDRGFITQVAGEDLAEAILQGLVERHAGPKRSNFQHSEEYRALAGATERCLVHLEPVIGPMMASLAASGAWQKAAPPL